MAPAILTVTVRLRSRRSSPDDAVAVSGKRTPLAQAGLGQGFAWITTFDNYSGRNFCVTLLKRKLDFKPGSVLGLRGDRLEHFTEEWFGECRYCLVHCVHEFKCFYIVNVLNERSKLKEIEVYVDVSLLLVMRS
ncbi:hypothetical protein EDC01DRAFT_635227 [Geopyxis carbonaria]|nr:hypothetical protein EDC01DRAFT_635227 [Geopyxis carbonaria]